LFNFSRDQSKVLSTLKREINHPMLSLSGTIPAPVDYSVELFEIRQQCQ